MVSEGFECVTHIPKPSSFSLSSLTIQHNSNTLYICYDECTNFAHKWHFVFECIQRFQASICSGFCEMNAVLMKMKIFYTKYHANYFMANGTVGHVCETNVIVCTYRMCTNKVDRVQSQQVNALHAKINVNRKNANEKKKCFAANQNIPYIVHWMAKKNDLWKNSVIKLTSNALNSILYAYYSKIEFCVLKF